MIVYLLCLPFFTLFYPNDGTFLRTNVVPAFFADECSNFNNTHNFNKIHIFSQNFGYLKFIKRCNKAGTEGTQLCTFCACLFLHFFIQMMEHFYGQMLLGIWDQPEGIVID